MCKRLFLLVVVLSPLLAPARDKAENWVEVRSPHFSVVSNSNEKQAHRVADQFEHMRSVFHTLFPKIQIDTLGSITVLAIKDEKDFRALEPAEYLAKGQLKLGGLFLRGPDKNYVLLRLDAEGEHPYAVVYHEYTHLLLSRAEWMPLWLNEGLAEFYQNTDIREKEVALGQPSPENLLLLRQNRLLPLATLFVIDHTSPYYHEEDRGSIFYAESWALTHYLEQRNFREKTNQLADYAQLLSQHVDAVTAATRAFGDLKQLQSALDGYVRQGSFQYFRIPGATDVDDTAFQSHALANAQADAVRADFLAYNQRTADARALLDRILQEDPNNVLAHETMGFLEFQERHVDEARNWYARAVKLDSQSYLAHYYFAAISMNSPLDTPGGAQVESSLRASIKLNPSFAPSYDRLAAFLAMHHRNLDEARMMALSAVQLEPRNLTYRMQTANVLLQMERGKDAVAVIRNAMNLASSPQETAMAEDFLRHAEEYAQAQEQNQRLSEQMKAGTPVAEATGRGAEGDVATDSAARDDALPNGPHHFVTGVLKNVHCITPAMDLNVLAAGKTLGMHSGNYFKIDYSSLGITLKGNLNPCADLEGRPAKVEYVNSASKGPAAMVAIEIHK
jgi:cytochrome c-type biogenesis protein CcmH/NrfG